MNKYTNTKYTKVKPDRTTVSLTRRNYEMLSKLGRAGESFDDVLTRLFTQLRIEQEIIR